MGRPLLLESRLAADLADAEHAIIELNAATPNLLDLEALARVLLRSEAVASSRLEGIVTTPRRLLRFENDQLEGTVAHRDVDAAEIMGNVAAMQHALSGIALKETFGLDDLIDLHTSLLAGTRLSDIAGEIRTKQNWIGGSDFHPCSAAFIPPPPEELAALLDDLVDYINGDEHSPLLQAGLAHAQFEALHPFADGNGRVCRVLIHLVLHRLGLAPRYVPPISLALASKSEAYFAGLNSFSCIA